MPLHLTDADERKLWGEYIDRKVSDEDYVLTVQQLYEEELARFKEEDEKPGKRNKYNARRVYVVEGHSLPFATRLAADEESRVVPHYGAKMPRVLRMDSMAEYRHYCQLLDRKARGEIIGLLHHPKFLLQPAFKLDGKRLRAIHYEADFQFSEDDVWVVQDVKGMQTKTFKLKWRLLLHQYRDRIEAGTFRFEIVEV